MCLTFTFESIINALSLIGGATQIVQMCIVPVFFYIEKQNVSLTKKILAFILMVFFVFIGIYNLVIFLLDAFKEILYLIF